MTTKSSTSRQDALLLCYVSLKLHAKPWWLLPRLGKGSTSQMCARPWHLLQRLDLLGAVSKLGLTIFSNLSADMLDTVFLSLHA